MKPLEKGLRSQLERTVLEARDIAEAAAIAALQQLGVIESAPFVHQSELERELRRRLRIHGRQLGDSLNGGKVQSMDRLVEEVAYEHWHRMLFARFLAENNLLMYPDPTNPVPVTLEECEDLAAREDTKNGWELAARFATHMLPQIFRVNSPVFQLTLPPEHQQKLEGLVEELPEEVFTASDSLGWVYQFWQAKKKGEVNASEVKIGARELPVVTQLFTEPYMVSFLLDNSLGAWWAARRLTKNDLEAAKSEEELRKKASLPGVPLEYLRFVKEESGLWTPAAGTFDGWPKHLSELKTLDPCCGSGHFLVAAFLMLVPMRMELEGLSVADAVDDVLRDNLHGLEIDRRCVELAAFTLALTAWRYPNSGGYRQLPELNIACSGLSIDAKKEDWIQLVVSQPSLQYTISQITSQFKDAPLLGSLINPELILGKGTIVDLKWAEIPPLFIHMLFREKDYEKIELGVVAQGIAKAAQLLSDKYNWIITNVPYLGNNKRDERLAEFCKKYYPDSKNDIATVFLERCLEMCTKRGTSSIVLPQNWLFLGSYAKLRRKLLSNENWQLIAWLGPGAFETISGEVVKVTLVILSKGTTGHFGHNLISGLDVSGFRTPSEKAVKLSGIEISLTRQAQQLENPDARVLLEETNYGILLSEYANTGKGVCVFDNPRFVFKFWEITPISNGWSYLQSTPSKNTLFSGMSDVLRWQNGHGDLCKLMKDKELFEGYKSGAWRAGSQFWGSHGILHGVMEDLPHSLYLGYPYDANTVLLVPKAKSDLLALLAFSDSKEFSRAVRKIDKKIMVTSATFVKVPFDLDRWTKVAKEKYPKGLPEPYSNEPTQWIYHGHPAKSDSPLQVAIALTLGYNWPAKIDEDLPLSNESRLWVKKSESLLSFVDGDGIVCIPSVRGESKAEDRLECLLATAYGNEWSSSRKSELLTQVGFAGKSLESWLRDGFFTQHCKLFHDRPFIWHVWDGLSDGFAALVNYHKLDAKKLEALIFTYLGDWISRQKQDIANGVDGAEEKLAAAEALKKRLELILEGEAPFDIFVRWKSLEEQSVGWNPDLNDGVRLNIRPFLSVPDVGKKGAGVLRDRPNIKWDKDRGKDVESAPWYKLFKGERVNDHHLSLVEKKKAL